MNCKTSQKCMSAFLSNELTTQETMDYVEHVSECKECNEELTIQYLVTEGMVRLEKGGAFNLNEELEEKLKESYRRAQLQSNLVFALGLATLVSVFAVIMVLIKVFLV